MNKAIKDKLRQIKYRVVARNMYHEFSKIPREECIFLLATPLHGNIGDQAIAYSEIEFFKNNYPEKTVVEIPSKYIINNLDFWEKLIGTHAICVHGGGFIGSLWKNEDYVMREVFRHFKKNKILVLPQSIYYTADDKSEITSLKKILDECVDITICERENYSHNFALSNFPNCKHLFIPDIVLYSQELRASEHNKKTDTIILCMREDHEKTSIVNSEDLDDFIRVNDLTGYELICTDTVVQNEIKQKERKEVIIEKINQFSHAKLVITDRLHGMVLAAIAGTPVIAFDNISHKVFGEYEWIKDIATIAIIRQLSEIKNARDMIDAQIEYDNSKLLNYFEKLKEMI